MKKHVQHTAGPWIVDRSVCGELEPFDARGRHLLNSNGPLTSRQREANAALIEQAPNLLAGLKEAYAHLQYLTPERFDDTEHEANWNRMLTEIEQTIEKAEGRES